MVLLEIAGGILFAPFITLLVVILLLASFGKSFGIRKAYVQLLLRLFEYGRVNIESATRHKEEVHEEPQQEPVFLKPDTPPSPRKNGLVKNLSQNGFASLISKESLILVPEGEAVVQNGHVDPKEEIDNVINNNSEKSDNQENSDLQVADKPIDFKIEDCLEYIMSGIEAIIEDDVTSRFEAEELKNWNLLTRTNRKYEFISWKLTVIWVIGFLLRYCLLMPLRVIICFIGVTWFVVAFAIVGLVPQKELRHKMNAAAFKIGFRVIARSIGVVADFHNLEYKPKNCGFCVANHTTPMDVAVMASDNCFSLIGQRHGGFLGVLQRALARASPHIWFERAESKDRSAVATRLRQHVSDPKNPPILIFPEGTCINNTSVMQFKKGSFEVGGVIYPVAIKYDPRFGDAFWNSSKYSMMQYLYMMMTSWAIVCDVWYLPPMYREEGESAIDFANRVKSVIAKQGGLVDLVWDGQLKRMKPKKEWKEKQQEEFTKRLKGD